MARAAAAAHVQPTQAECTSCQNETARDKPNTPTETGAAEGKADGRKHGSMLSDVVSVIKNLKIQVNIWKSFYAGTKLVLGCY